MLPPGHIAAGYLTAKIVLGSLNYDLTASQINQLTLIGTFLSFAPDLDFFVAFAKFGKFRIDTEKKINHRKFLTHVPIIWLALGLIIFFANATPFGKALGLLVWIGPWVHFILDSEWGIMWLWPFSKRFYPFSESFYARKYEILDRQGFWKYWLGFVSDEYKKPKHLLEILIVLAALIVFFK